MALHSGCILKSPGDICKVLISGLHSRSIKDLNVVTVKLLDENMGVIFMTSDLAKDSYI